MFETHKPAESEFRRFLGWAKWPLAMALVGAGFWYFGCVPAFAQQPVAQREVRPTNLANAAMADSTYALAFAACVNQTVAALGPKRADKSCRETVKEDRDRAGNSAESARPVFANWYDNGDWYPPRSTGNWSPL